MKTSNPFQAAIQEAHREMNGWRNDAGQTANFHNAQGPVFYPEQNWSRDMGTQVYHDPGRKGVEVSLPHILNIAIAAAANFTVNIFGATRNYNAANFGNNVNVTVTYISGNPLVPFTYGDLLGSILGEPMQVGITRIDAVTTTQAQAQLNLLRNPGVSKFEGQGLFPLIYPNQFVQTITYVEDAYKVDKYQTLTYIQNGATDAAIQMRFYQNANVNLDRAFSNQKVVSEYAKPQTGISQQTQLVVPAAASAALTRSPQLL